MKKLLLEKITRIKERHEEISMLLSDSLIIKNKDKFRELSKEYAQVSPIIENFNRYNKLMDDIDYAQNLIIGDDQDLKKMAAAELIKIQDESKVLLNDLEISLLPQNPNDNSNVFLEIRAGTGGDEAAIFSGDLFRMYSRFAEKNKWKIDIVSQNFGDHGGYKEIISKISGLKVYADLKFESGVHRVQRIPETESQGRVHTSACTVAVMPEVKEVNHIHVDTNDLRIDTFRASGAGGQHVNKTDSAIRITHIPTGLVVECQSQRSQHKNRAEAIAVLKSRLLQREIDEQQEKQAESRRKLVGSGDRSERIRTYNYPQGRVTDHRINVTVYKLDYVMQGELYSFINPLKLEYYSLLNQDN